MKRVLAALSVAAMLAGFPGISGVGQAGAAGQPDVEYGRSFTLTERSQGQQIDLTGLIEADVPISCSAGMVWTYRQNFELKVLVKASCRIQHGHRKEQKATLTVTATEIKNGKEEEFSSCTDSAISDKKTGVFKLSCYVPVEPAPAGSES